MEFWKAFDNPSPTNLFVLGNTKFILVKNWFRIRPSKITCIRIRAITLTQISTIDLEINQCKVADPGGVDPDPTLRRKKTEFEPNIILGSDSIRIRKPAFGAFWHIQTRHQHRETVQKTENQCSLRFSENP